MTNVTKEELLNDKDTRALISDVLSTSKDDIKKTMMIAGAIKFFTASEQKIKRKQCVRG